MLKKINLCNYSNKHMQTKLLLNDAKYSLQLSPLLRICSPNHQLKYHLTKQCQLHFASNIFCKNTIPISFNLRIFQFNLRGNIILGLNCSDIYDYIGIIIYIILSNHRKLVVPVNGVRWVIAEERLCRAA